ncbi:MAG: DUF3090 family protein [Anaerolineae bacterium]|nr:DUF3090 family protein [Anaerolineae bacterium]
MSPEFLGLSHVEFITIDAMGPPGERTFYLQAQQGDMLVTLLIEKEHAAALSIGIQQMLENLGGLLEDEDIPTDMALRQPIHPLFQVGSMGLGYDPDEDALVIIARAPAIEEMSEDSVPEVHFWCSRARSFALAEYAAIVVASGRPRCPVCNEPLDKDELHVCTRGNGRKKLFEVGE